MKKIIVLNLFALLLASCGQQSAEETKDQINETAVEEPNLDLTKYNDQSKYTTDQLDTLVVNLTSFIYMKPADAQWDNKFEPRFRPYYIEHSKVFELVYLKEMPDSSYYYYLIRDARGRTMYTQRGVAGRFKMNADMSLYDFEEIVNTPAASHEKLVEIGGLFMEELTSTGNLDKYLDDKTKVEYPDGRLFYSKQKFEWRYVD